MKCLFHQKYLRNCKVIIERRHSCYFRMSLTIKTIIFDLSEVLVAGLCGVDETLAPRVGSPPSEVLSAGGRAKNVALDKFPREE